ncbi:hypothetical protein Fcan01_24268 [Folsomia candida]|uniref:DUF4806 domain-containing protein n=1 Tax=Folsomia candida TaxID=158441 RepID=A0A226D7C3_FOLCA|nr:hypothetical protein Fcan01_24268 [Folsomia candida]
MFAVVHFTSSDDDSVQLVPSSWLDKTRTQCRWPSGRKANQISASLIKSCSLPQDNWPYLPCSFKKSFSDYQAGRRTEKKIAEDSNLSSSDPDVGAGRSRKRSRITKKLSKHIDDLRIWMMICGRPPLLLSHNPNNVGQFSQGIIGTSSVDHIEELNNPMSTTYLYVDANSLNLDLNEENMDLESRNTDETDRNLNTISTFINLPPSLPTNLQPESHQPVGKTFTELWNRQIALEKLVVSSFSAINSGIGQLLLRTKQPSKSKEIQLPIQLPLQSIEDVQKLEEWITLESNAQDLVEVLGSFGGTTPQKVVTTMLLNLLSNSLAIKTNFIGANDKFGFKDSKLFASVIRALNENDVCRSSKKAEFIKWIQTWLQNARPKKNENVVQNEAEEN